ncbi:MULTISPECIES: hypothetical protein [Mycobacterium]|uniref:Uncharacterized protein n=1 Tax=Mycobacterium avium subsp. hominissuis TaxID=439334 RepID=A0A2A3L985_MYCAV|nr:MULTISPECIES: hypothetical protein [Mycobacterium]MBZ4632862.1 hypothetical protein [Mycobacterium avium subsp. hominissuis]PBJ35414.1 hypothetical protein XV03_10900 [Mycobacterium avium subsp. hominissuis]
MRADEVACDDVVVDCEGAVWVHEHDRRGWRYFAVTGEAQPALSFDEFTTLPANYEPYTVLDAAASHAIRRSLSHLDD